MGPDVIWLVKRLWSWSLNERAAVTQSQNTLTLQEGLCYSSSAFQRQHPEMFHPEGNPSSRSPSLVFSMRIYLGWFQKTLTSVSSRANIKPVLMAVQTLGITGIGGQTHLILARLDTKVSVFGSCHLSSRIGHG